ncbi:hypothetical protein [Thioalkalivibrio sp. AKL17]|uniref:hypothetical protein n=1 Tax=Thioalkalivibrio sp. AKL17 TaxID=1158160 RepID=UPI001FCA746C|nr:hypothetical protein [Thioalkalivibrio sp. AKL17]
MTRHFCQMLGGEIRVVSEYGEGSTFTMELPVTTPSGETPPEVRGGESATGNATHGTTILVVDDDPSVRDLLARQLRTVSRSRRTANRRCRRPGKSVRWRSRWM